MKRPLCLFVALFAALLFIWGLLPFREEPPGLAEDGKSIVLQGVLQKREVKNGHLIWHLSDAAYTYGSGFHAVSTVGSDQFQNLFDGNGKKAKVICYMKEEAQAMIGSRIRLCGRVALFSHGENEGQFEEADFYFKKGYAFKVFGGEEVTVLKPGSRIREGMAGLRERTDRFYREALGESRGSVLSAMILGEKSGMDAEIKNLYRQNGIAHILAISGLHISLIGLGFYRILRRAGVPILPGAAAGCGLLLFYALLVGGGSSVVRASVMLFLQILADVCERSYDLLTAMAFSGLLLLCFRREYLSDAGFLLSFLAVFGIALLSPMFGTSSLAATLGVSLTTLPVLLWYYFEFPLYSIVLNLLLVPLLSVALVSGIAGGLLRLALLLKPADLVLGLYETVCHLFLKLPFHTLLTGRPKVWQVVLYYVLLAGLRWLYGFCRRRYLRLLEKELEEEKLKRKWLKQRMALVLFLMVIPGILFLNDRRIDGVDMLSIGQGDCLVLRDSQGNAILYDAGSSDVKEAGKYRLIPYLKYNGIRRVEAVYLSHPHADHYSALAELYEQCGENAICVGDLYVSSPAKTQEAYEALFAAVRKAGRQIRLINPGDRQRFGRWELLALHPEADFVSEDVNDTSLVLYGRNGAFSVLLTGDATSMTDDRLIAAMKKYGIKGVDCLKAEHHGSELSNSKPLLTALHPQTAIISCGRNNSYGHPHEAVLMRLKEKGIRFYVTAETGQIRVLIGEKGYRISLPMK